MTLKVPLFKTELKVSPLHTLHLADSGGQQLPCAVFLHGGPGSGCREEYLELFDCTRCRVILPDQRGSGRSVPHGLLTENTTASLIADLDTIRRHYKVERWLIVGGSWGSLLALAYAQKYPERVSGLVLRALFLGTDAELERAFLTLPAVFYPQMHHCFVSLVAAAENHNILDTYYRLLLDDDPQVSRAAALVWYDYERCLSALSGVIPSFPPDLNPTNAPVDRRTPSTPRMEAHYFSQQCFLAPNQLLDGMEKMKHIPGIVVQSRYDLLCPPKNAYRLLNRWSAGKAVFVERAGHSQSEIGVMAAMRAAILELLV